MFFGVMVSVVVVLIIFFKCVMVVFDLCFFLMLRKGMLFDIEIIYL